MTDLWPTMARNFSFPAEPDNPFSSTSSYSNGNFATSRTLVESPAVDSFKDRHDRLMSAEKEKNKLIEVGSLKSYLRFEFSLNMEPRTSCLGSKLLKPNIKDPASTMRGKSASIGKCR